MKRIYLLAGGFVLLCGILIVLVLLWSHNSSSTVAPGKQKTEPERGGPPVVYITNTNQLNNYLLSQQFEAVRQETSDYILSHVSSGISHAHITKTTLNQDGSITFTIQTDDPPKTSITVILDRDAANYTMTFTVPKTGFSAPLNVYSSQDNGSDY